MALKNTTSRPRALGLSFVASLLLSTPLLAKTPIPVSEEDHLAFEKKFAEMCIEKEKSELKGSGVLLDEVIGVCECIAKEESKRVTSQEVREFVIEGHYPASLMMKSNAATYTCVDSKAK
jgi:hypothetical protein